MIVDRYVERGRFEVSSPRRIEYETLGASLQVSKTGRCDHLVVRVVLEEVPEHDVETQQYEDDEECGAEYGTHSSLSVTKFPVHAHFVSRNPSCLDSRSPRSCHGYCLQVTLEPRLAYQRELELLDPVD